MARVLIVGSGGQDGTLLRESLDSQKIEYLGIGRNTTHSNITSWKNSSFDIKDSKAILTLMRDFSPNVVYYLAAAHQSAEQGLPSPSVLLQDSLQTHVLSPGYFLEAIRNSFPLTRFFYAASSHVFGQCKSEIQDESTPFSPTSIYGVTKLAGLLTCRYYRETHGIFASSGILYNHESPLRSKYFLSKKIVAGIREIQEETSKELVIGSLSSICDWGAASDYVLAMQAVMTSTAPNEFIVASGERRTVQDFVAIAFELVGLPWKRYVREEKTIIRSLPTVLIGNPSRLKSATGWKPKVSFEELVRQLLLAEGVRLNG